MILLAFLLLLLSLVDAQFDYPTAILTNQWLNNNVSLIHSVLFDDGSLVRAILLRSPSYGSNYAFGFYCTGPSSFSPCEKNSYLLAVFIVQTNSGGRITMPSSGFPRTVWYANRDHLVGENAALNFTSAGDLSLWDSDGTLVWSTNTSERSVKSLSLQPTGNLVLADAWNGTIWQSFDHPADILALGQQLRSGVRLTSNTYFNNSTQGMYFMEMGRTGLALYADGPVMPQSYWWLEPYNTLNKTIDRPYAEYGNGSLNLFISNISNPDRILRIPLTQPQSLSYLQLGADGKIQVYSWVGTSASWTMLVDLQETSKEDCSIPTICGPYGICNNGQCSCLQASSANGSQSDDAFRPVMSSIPSMGCIPEPPIVCNASSSAAPNHHFLSLDDFYYPNVLSLPSLNDSMPIEDCEQRCLQNCSCMAAIFLYMNGENETLGTCFPVSKLYTLTPNAQIDIHWKSVALIRMQSQLLISAPSNWSSIPPPSIPLPGLEGLKPEERQARASDSLRTILSAVLSSIAVAILLLLGSILAYRRREKRRELAIRQEEEEMLQAMPGVIPTRFSLKEMEAATNNFSNKLGVGGFGSVYWGSLQDGSHVAVKRLESTTQGQGEFLTEVRIIGSIRHVNLVRLRGFCAEREHRMLVYEYMPNGSLEKWLLTKSTKELDWQLRFNIALGIARGLAYLHEECSERIIHLDIKPPNILLDHQFVAKVSDFGMSKLMSREQSHVMTRMRGTPGYLAPEWLHANITEKVDVYSFGILVFEIASGRKSLDMFADDSCTTMMHIPVWASRMVEKGRLMDIIDPRLSKDFSREQAEIVIKVAFLCIQENPTARPSMSIVVQMLEGVIECPDPSFIVSHLLQISPTLSSEKEGHINPHSAMDSKPLASVLSGPR